jgi:hypothetical protein
MLVWRRYHIGLSGLSIAGLLLLTACAKKEGGGKPPIAPPMQVSVATVEQRDVPLDGDWVTEGRWRGKANETQRSN